MSNRYNVTSDEINKKERQYINRVIKALEGQGHTCRNGGVGPNEVQHFGLKASSKGMIGIQIIGGRCGWTASDCVHGIQKGYYHYDKIIFCGCKEFHTGKHITAADMDTKMKRAHDAKKGLESMYLGKTPNEFNEKYQKYFRWILTDSFNDLLEQLTGDYTGNASGDSNSDSSSSTPTYKNAIDSIKDLIAPWDGEVEVKIRDDTVYINRIDNSEHELLIKEGFNIVKDSITVHDYNPDTINTLHATYAGKKVTLIDDYLVERFGTHEHTVEAKQIITRYTEGEITKDTKTEETTDKNKEKDTKNQTSAKRKVSYAETPITKKSDAIKFIKREWNKLRRKNGHGLELKVIGNNKFKSGEWVRVLIPNFNEDTLMYISKTQHNASPSEEWLTSLTLTDYPPQLSEPKTEETEKQKQEDTNTKTDDNTVPEEIGGDTDIKTNTNKNNSKKKTTTNSKSKNTVNVYRKRQALG